MNDAGALLDFPQQQPTGIGADLAAVEFRHFGPAPEAVKSKLYSVSLCHYKAVLLLGHNWLITRLLC